MRYILFIVYWRLTNGLLTILAISCSPPPQVKHNPTMTEEAANFISDAYADLRTQVAGSKGRTLPVTARTLETIIRLRYHPTATHRSHILSSRTCGRRQKAYPVFPISPFCVSMSATCSARSRSCFRSRPRSSAHAKCHLRDEVTTDDAKKATELLKYAILAEDFGKASAPCLLQSSCCEHLRIGAPGQWIALLQSCRATALVCRVAAVIACGTGRSYERQRRRRRRRRRR